MTARILMLAAVSALTLQGCAPVALIYADKRGDSKAAIAPLVARAHPDVDTDAATTCVVKGMTYGEVFALPTSDATKDAAANQVQVTELLARPIVSGCIAALPRVQPVVAQ